MELKGKFEVYLDLKCSADKFFKLLSSEIHHIPNASSDKIHAIEVHEGDWKTAGSVKLWTYTIDGKAEICKEKVDIDQEKKTVKMTAVEGHVLQQYKSYKVSLQAAPKGRTGDCIVTVCLEYEKLKDNDERPTKYLDFTIRMVKDVDAHLVKAY